VSSFKFDDPYISDEERKQTREAARSYFDLAQSYVLRRPLLFVTVGLTGTGKTTVAGALAKRLGLTVLSSDVIRKNLAGVPLTEHQYSEVDSGLYSAEMSQRTYDKMFAEAELLLGQGRHVMLDATFLKSQDRLKALKLAEKYQADSRIVETCLAEARVKERLDQRTRGKSVSDGRWEIYLPQKQKFEPVAEVPAEKYFKVDTGLPLFEQISRISESL
jgi:predicted kinase